MHLQDHPMEDAFMPPHSVILPVTGRTPHTVSNPQPAYTHPFALPSKDKTVEGRLADGLKFPAAPPADAVHLPAHYARFKIEPIYFIMENGFDFETGNVIKYVCRAPHKNGVEDLKKARRYLDMMILKAEGQKDYAK